MSCNFLQIVFYSTTASEARRFTGNIRHLANLRENQERGRNSNSEMAHKLQPYIRFSSEASLWNVVFKAT